MKTKIYLEDIKIFAHHGVLPQETMIGTYYIVNAELHADLSKAVLSDDLDDTINYAEINEVIHQEMAQPSRLLEHVIGRIINQLEASFPQLSFVKIRLTKTRPPMQGEMQGVSLELEKHFGG